MWYKRLAGPRPKFAHFLYRYINRNPVDGGTQTLGEHAAIKTSPAGDNNARVENDRAMRRCLRLPPPWVSVKDGYESSGFGKLLLVGEEPRDEPEIVPQHAPGHREVAVVEAAAAQPSPLALLQDGDATLGRATPFLQPREVLVFEALPQLPGILGADRVVDAALRELFGSARRAEAPVRGGRRERRRQVEVGCFSIAAGTSSSPFPRRSRINAATSTSPPPRSSRISRQATC